MSASPDRAQSLPREVEPLRGNGPTTACGAPHLARWQQQLEREPVSQTQADVLCLGEAQEAFSAKLSAVP